MTSADEKSLALRKWIFAGLMVAAGVLLSPMFSFPLGVTKAFPLQHMINIFLAVLCGTRYGTAAAFGTSLIRNLLGTGSLLAFPGSMVGAFLSAYIQHLLAYSQYRLQRQRALADAGFSSQQCQRPLHQSAAQLSVKFIVFHIDSWVVSA